jgi:hypothetical protein
MFEDFVFLFPSYFFANGLDEVLDCSGLDPFVVFGFKLYLDVSFELLVLSVKGWVEVFDPWVSQNGSFLS